MVNATAKMDFSGFLTNAHLVDKIKPITALFANV